jgi:curved DNA-binding protein CbpA
MNWVCYRDDPNKNRDYSNAEEDIKSISIAYQTLSDPQLRHEYNAFGPKESVPEGGFIDPEDVFGAIISGERFLPLIGQLSFARVLKTLVQMADAIEGNNVATPVQRDDNGREIISFEKKARGYKEMRKEVRLHHSCGPVAVDALTGRVVQLSETWEARVQKLCENLCDKLAKFTENATSPTDAKVTESWRRICSLEAE